MLFISVEGIDGAGKTTLVNLLKEHMKGRGYKVVAYREPGGTPKGERIREFLLSQDLDIRSELLLFLASRAILVSEEIIRRLEEGYVVILDRFTDSTIAYQGYGRRIDLELVKNLCDFASYGIKPDITFLIDIDPKKALERIGERRTRFEDLNFLRKVREGFLELATEESDRIRVLNGERSKEEILEEALRYIDEVLSRRNRRPR